MSLSQTEIAKKEGKESFAELLYSQLIDWVGFSWTVIFLKINSQFDFVSNLLRMLHTFFLLFVFLP